MDVEEETKRFKWLLIAGLFFLVSAYFSWRELKYAAFGNTADARVVRAYEYNEVGRGGRRYPKIAFEYEFTDKDGTVRKESDHVSPEDAPPDGPTVLVEYINGPKGGSRLPANSKRWWLIVFFGSLGFAGYKIWGLVKESRS